ncbi:energy-coupling factor transport system ATP-binding protein [Mumia flava]|uniref:Energy-coupling factor transport system ATP-binding protein n=1 Tax=Mumia flava TaxID=1348852 RepID=A0A2M9BJ55_9ACTN|nr:ATP-binding cassette domain-containing protein [Mumia flava]PJJ57983.1 energy-coupling factor transport system ATP-binding protein [Mumia flava]
MTTTAATVETGAARIRDLTWRPLGRTTPVLDGLDLDVAPGERVLLAGPSGAGKSTVLRALAGVLESAGLGERTGEVAVGGRTGMLLQNPGDAVVAERIGRDVAFGLENARLPRDPMPRRVADALAAVRLPYGPGHPTAALSGGEQQRLALAGVLACEPDLLLLDEPTSMLDEPNAVAVRACVLEALDRTGAGLVVVEHRIEPWLAHVDRVVVLDAHGAVVRDADPEGFASTMRDELAAAGVWMPGAVVPEPVLPPSVLVAPDGPVPTLRAEGLGVDLRRVTMRGTTLTPALHAIDTEVDPAAVTAFTGPSGAGKSTLLAAFGGLLAPTSGRVHAPTRKPLHRTRSRDLARLLGWVPQNPEHGFLTTRVRDEVAATGGRLGVTVDVDAVLDHLGLTQHADAHPYRLSGGEQRRLALAAALAHRPAVALLDEPTVGQDRRTWAAVAGWMRGAADAGAAVAAATHDAVLIALTDHRVALPSRSVTPAPESAVENGAAVTQREGEGAP